MMALFEANAVAQAHRAATIRLRDGRPASPEQAARDRRELLLLARRSGDAALLADALTWGHDALLVLGQDDEARAARDESRRLAEALNDPARLAVCDICEAQACQRGGRGFEAISTIRQALPQLGAFHDAPRVRMVAEETLSALYEEFGLWDEACQAADQSADLARARADLYALERARFRRLRIALSRAQANNAALARLPADDPDVLQVVSSASEWLHSREAHDRTPALASCFRELLFEALLCSGQDAEAAALWRATADSRDHSQRPLLKAQVAGCLEGPQRALDILLPSLASPTALSAEDRAKAWRMVADAHEKLGDARAAFEALCKHIDSAFGQSPVLAKSKAALLALELRAEREKLQTQRALIHAGKLAAMGQLAGSAASAVERPADELRRSSAAARRAAQDRDAARLAERLDAIERQVEGLGGMVRRMKAFSRDDPVRLEDMALRAAVDEACGLCRPALDAAGVRCRIEGADATVRTDRERIVLALVNLINNALDAMRGQTDPPPLLRVQTTAQRAVAGGNAQEVSLSVIDNGPGLSTHARANLMQPFFTSKQAQLGLGLTITRQALMEAGARLEVGNAPAGGACFSVLLPMVEGTLRHRAAQP
jgi:C4-dicarboxylate-specific signal transduction histidine kinase